MPPRQKTSTTRTRALFASMFAIATLIMIPVGSGEGQVTPPPPHPTSSPHLQNQIQTKESSEDPSTNPSEESPEEGPPEGGGGDTSLPEDSKYKDLSAESIKTLKEDAHGRVIVEDLKTQEKLVPRVEIIVDSSGSMAQSLSKDKTKMFYMKKLLTRYFIDKYKENIQTGLRVYGSRRKGDCKDSELLIPFQAFNLERIEYSVSKLEPLGKTPLFRSVKMALQDLKSYPGPKKLIVFTDGEDTCGGNPCKDRVSKDEESDTEIFLVAIKFTPKGDDLKSISCLGDVLRADSEEEMFDALGQINQKIFSSRINLKVLSPNPSAPVQLFRYEASGKWIPYRTFTAAFGTTVPPGRYQAIVELDPLYKFDSFEILKGKVVTLAVKGTGNFEVNFVDKVLDAEFLDKNLKPIAKFKSDTVQKIPTGKWTLKIFKQPFYETLVQSYYIYPGGQHKYPIKDVGALVVKSKKLTGLYVYNNKKTAIGNYLTNAPFALPLASYTIFVDKNCSFENVQPASNGKLQVLQCPTTPQEELSH